MVQAFQDPPLCSSTQNLALCFCVLDLLTGQKVYIFIVLNFSFRWKKRSRRDRRLEEENAGDEKSEQNLREMETGGNSQTETEAEDQRTASGKLKDHIVEVREVRGGTCTRLAGSADQLL